MLHWKRSPRSQVGNVQRCLGRVFLAAIHGAKGAPVLRNSSTTAPLRLPEAPVTRIMVSSFAIPAVWYNGDEGSRKYVQISKPEGRWANERPSRMSRASHYQRPFPESGRCRFYGIFRSARFASPDSVTKLFDITEKVLTDQLRQLEQDGVNPAPRYSHAAGRW